MVRASPSHSSAAAAAASSPPLCSRLSRQECFKSASYIGTALHAHLRATGLALLASQWVIAEAVGAGVGGALIDHFPIREVMLVAAVLPLVSAVLVFPVFRGFTIVDHRSRQNEVREDTAVAEPSVVRVLAMVARGDWATASKDQSGFEAARAKVARPTRMRQRTRHGRAISVRQGWPNERGRGCRISCVPAKCLTSD